MLKYLATTVIASMLNTAAILPGQARQVSDAIDVSGVIESEMAMGTENGDAQKADLVLEPEFGFQLSATTRLSVIGRLHVDSVDELEPGKPDQRNRSTLSKRLLIGEHTDLELREAYLDTELGNTFLRLGKQQVVWGQADGLKVLDILNPQSFREFILDDFEDSRIPLWTVNAEIPIADAMLQLLWIPDKTYDDIPAADALFAFTSPLLVPQVPEGVPVRISPLKRPGAVLSDSDFGAKLSAFAGGWDLSLNYAYHYFDRPVVRREISADGITIRQDYERTHLLGGAFSTVFSDFTLRGEVGYSSDRYYLSEEPVDSDGVTHSGELAYVLGLDYQGVEDWFISAQVFQSVLTDTQPGLVRDRAETTATLLLQADFLNETLQAKTLFIQNLKRGDGVVQASLNYQWNTNINLKIGADVFYGNADGLYGQFRENDRVSVGIELGF